MTRPLPCPKDRWKWFGNAGHFICGAWCRFHLCTQIGPWLVSTVGDYHPVSSIRALGERSVADEIGYGRKYETMVFVAGVPCTAKGCACGLPTIDGGERDFAGYNDAGAATIGHMKMCEKWARRRAPKEAKK